MPDLTSVQSLPGMRDFVYDPTHHVFRITTVSGDLVTWDPVARTSTSVHIGLPLGDIDISHDGNTLLVASTGPIHSDDYSSYLDYFYKVDLTTGATHRVDVTYPYYAYGQSHIMIDQNDMVQWSLGSGQGNALRFALNTSDADIASRVNTYDSTAHYGTYVKSETGKYILVEGTNTSDGPLSLFDAVTNTNIGAFSFYQAPYSGAFNVGRGDVSEAAHLAVDITYNQFVVFDLNLHVVKDLSSTQFIGQKVDAHFNTNGHQLFVWETAVFTTGAQQIHVYDTSTWQEVGTFAPGITIDHFNNSSIHGHLGESSDGKFLFLQGQDQFVTIDLAAQMQLTLTGTAGDDTLYGAIGNDTFTGGAGVDTAVFSGNLADYTITKSGDYFTLTSAVDGKDVVTGVEIFRFKDGQVDASDLVVPPSPANHAPTGSATETLPRGAEDTPYTVHASSLLQGFSDPDGDSLSVIALTATHASVTGGPIDFIVTPEANYNGPVTLSYKVSDGHGGSIDASRTFILDPVNDIPHGVDDTVTTEQDTPVTISFASLFANDIDVENDGFSMYPTSSAVNGTITQSSDSFVFTPTPGFSGIASFGYFAVDGGGYPEWATVTVNVTASSHPNHNPNAVSDTTSTTQNTAVTLSIASLLANDTDADGNSLTLTAVNGASHGAVAISGSNVIFTPTAGYTGGASFGYDISDGHGGTAHATVSVNVTAAPPPATSGFVRLTDAANTVTYATAKAGVQVQALGGNDDVTGSKYADSLNGGDGNDVLRGGAGNDTLTGGKGGDRMQGGADNDKFVFNAGDLAITSQTGGQVDQIIDFHGAGTTNAAIEQDYIVLTGFGTGATLAFDHYGSTHAMQYYKVTDPTDATHNGVILVQMADGTAKLSLADYIFTH